MRSSQVLLAAALATVTATLGACVKSDTCAPVTTMSAFAYRCSAPPPPPPPAPEPPPVAKPEPPPEPPPKAVVSAEKIEVTETVQFETGSAVLKPESETLLDEVAGVLTKNPDITKVEVQGYTDSTSTRSFNMKLSKDRAAAVMAYLIKKGIAKDRLTSKGFGPDSPVADNGTDDGRFKNRRVEFKIVERKAAP